MPEFRIAYCCYFGQPSGYSRAAHDYLMALNLMEDVELSIIPINPKWDINELEPCYSDLLPFVHYKMDDLPTHVVVHAMPHQAIEFMKTFEGRLEPQALGEFCPVCVTTWETSRISFTLARELERWFECIITPSRSSRAALGVCGPVSWIRVVPHAIDVDFWINRERANELRKEKPYSFYTIGAWGERKNIEGLLKAYLTCFIAEDDVVLRILCPNMDTLCIPAIKQASNLDGYFPAVEASSERVSMETLRWFHEENDCYISLSRGEAWGLGAFEAMALGNPVILSDVGGHKDFMETGNTVPAGRLAKIPGSMTPVIPMAQEVGGVSKVGGQHYRTRSVVSQSPVGVNGRQMWFEPDLEEAQRAMINAYKCRAGRLLSGNGGVDQLRADMANRYSYRAVGEAFLEALEDCL